MYDCPCVVSIVVQDCPCWCQCRRCSIVLSSLYYCILILQCCYFDRSCSCLIVLVVSFVLSIVGLLLVLLYVSIVVSVVLMLILFCSSCCCQLFYCSQCQIVMIL